MNTIDRVGIALAPIRLAALAAALLLPTTLSAHDFRAGSVVIDHPFAPPTPAGARTGAVYFRALQNRGAQPDALVGASSGAAASVEIHRTTRDGDVARMRQIDRVELPPGVRLESRPGGDWHLMLIDLKAPLLEGERFPMTLRFERGGQREVMVWVQRPRDAGASPGHRH
jgi:copper(I)-binding protein